MIQRMARDIGSPLTHIEICVTDEDNGMRLDHLLTRELPWRSRADLQRRIRERLILVDGQAARPAQRMQPGMRINVEVGEAAGVASDIPLDMPLNFLHEDPWMMVLNKTAGTVVHPVGRYVNDTLLNVLHARHAREPKPPGNCAPMIVHRLDKDTSGVLVFATDPDVRKIIGLAFETRRMRKTYLALVHGEPANDKGEIDLPIGSDTNSAIRQKMAVMQDGRLALTRYETLLRCGTFSLLRFLPLTGRQHQIRVHAEAFGHPLLCDRLYGVPDPDPEQSQPFTHRSGLILERQALHAESLRFPHPISKAELHLYAPLAPDLAALLPSSH
ncbi:MAG: RluA family pseudouridine synthase [Planctomycetes bacterium]|nr:RluA family pseudouridine synthase [Planctomycetota bacterium]